MASAYPYAGGKGTLWSAYGVSMAFLIQFYLTIMADWGLTITNPNKSPYARKNIERAIANP